MIPRLVFADTSAIYPIFAPNDFLKNLCVDILHELLEEYQVSIITTNWVQYECLSRLKKHGIECCKKFEEMIKRDILTVRRVEKELEDKGLQIFWNFQDKTWGIVDCVSIAFMQSNSIYYTFAQDEHFEQAGLFPLLELDRNNKPVKAYKGLIFY